MSLCARSLASRAHLARPRASRPSHRRSAAAAQSSSCTYNYLVNGNVAATYDLTSIQQMGATAECVRARAPALFSWVWQDSELMDAQNFTYTFNICQNINWGTVVNPICQNQYGSNATAL